MADVPAESQQPRPPHARAILEMEPQTPPSHSITAAPSMRTFSTSPAQMQIQEPQSMCFIVGFFHSMRQQQYGATQAQRSVLLSSLSSSPATAAKSLQSCPTLCDPRDGSPPGSPVPGILQERTLSGLPFPSPMHESEK